MAKEDRDVKSLKTFVGPGVEKNPDNLTLRKWSELEFAHNSEREFARLLDFYRIKWYYEPVTFTVSWKKGGQTSGKFTPDFYLPDYDLFIEITTMNQKLVTRKNRKVRRLGELYPQARCKVFYQRDYKSLLFKYGLTPEKKLDT